MRELLTPNDSAFSLITLITVCILIIREELHSSYAYHAVRRYDRDLCLHGILFHPE